MEVNKVIHGDCIEIMGTIADEAIDLIFTDPPYNIGKPYPHGDKRNDYREFCRIWIGECFRVLKPTGSIYIKTLSKHLEWKMPIMAGLGIFINLITWRNVAASHDRRRFWGEYEPIMYYGKTKDYKFNRYAETIDNGQRRWGGYSKGSGFKGQMKDRWDDIPFVYAGSIQHPEAIMEPGTNKKKHPCQMPLGLPMRGIRFSSDPDDVVFDPFGGVGTTGLAARTLGRKYLLCDESEEYCEIARERIETTPVQLSLCDV